MPPRKKIATAPAASGWVETLKTLLYAGVIALGVRTVLVEPFNIPSGSMIPTLLVGDFLFVSKYSYGYSRYSIPFAPPVFGWTSTGRVFGSLPKRGDVVVFRFTRDTSVNYVKRVIGLPGDHVQMKAGKLWINRVELPRDTYAGNNPEGDYEVPDNHSGTRILAREYMETLPDGLHHHILKYSDEEHLDIANEVDANNTPEYVVPQNDLFMMGDNRDDSSDSRFQNELGFVPVENLVGRAQFIFFSFDGAHPWWQFWMWPFEIRWSRFLKAVD